jgi:hypothetical protein
MLSPQLYEVLAQTGPEQHPIQSPWQHAAVPAWCPVPPTAVCEVAYTLLDLLVGGIHRFGPTDAFLCH